MFRICINPRESFKSILKILKIRYHCFRCVFVFQTGRKIIFFKTPTNKYYYLYYYLYGTIHMVLFITIKSFKYSNKIKINKFRYLVILSSWERYLTYHFITCYDIVHLQLLTRNKFLKVDNIITSDKVISKILFPR